MSKLRFPLGAGKPSNSGGDCRCFAYLYSLPSRRRERQRRRSGSELGNHPDLCLTVGRSRLPPVCDTLPGSARSRLIIWMRHGARDDRAGDVSDAQAATHNCAQQSRLTAQGQAQARKVGGGMRSLGLPIAAVHAARICRTESTARLLDVGPVTTDTRLDEASTWHDRGGNAAYQKAVFAILSTQPPPGQAVVEVTSKLTIPSPQPGVLAALGPAPRSPAPRLSPRRRINLTREADMRSYDAGGKSSKPERY